MTAAESVNEEAVEAAAKAMIALTGIEPDDADMDEAKAVARAALAAAVPHLERRIRESIAGEEREAAWDARQQAIGECIVDLSSALGSDSTSWQQLLELARLHREIVGNARAARGSVSS